MKKEKMSYIHIHLIIITTADIEFLAKTHATNNYLQSEQCSTRREEKTVFTHFVSYLSN